MKTLLAILGIVAALSLVAASGLNAAQVAHGEYLNPAGKCAGNPHDNEPGEVQPNGNPHEVPGTGGNPHDC